MSLRKIKVGWGWKESEVRTNDRKKADEDRKERTFIIEYDTREIFSPSSNSLTVQPTIYIHPPTHLCFLLIKYSINELVFLLKNYEECTLIFLRRIFLIYVAS